jgi:DNA-binding MarR family transcriptional regulator
MTPKRALDSREVGMHEVLKRFRVLLRSMEAHYRRVEERSGLGGAQVWALSEIDASEGGLTVGELADRLAIHLSTASNLVRRLEELKLVTRNRSREDQRVVQLGITAAGRRKLEQAPKPSMGLLQQALSEMSAGELDALGSELDKLLRRMRHLDRRAGTMVIAEILSRKVDR